MELLTQRLANLLTVKSLVTVILTAVFAAMAGTGRVTTEQFLTVFTVVIAFYFGTQAEKRAQALACRPTASPGRGTGCCPRISGCGSSPAGTGQTW